MPDPKHPIQRTTKWTTKLKQKSIKVKKKQKENRIKHFYLHKTYICRHKSTEKSHRIHAHSHTINSMYVYRSTTCICSTEKTEKTFPAPFSCYSYSFRSILHFEFFSLCVWYIYTYHQACNEIEKYFYMIIIIVRAI